MNSLILTYNVLVVCRKTIVIAPSALLSLSSLCVDKKFNHTFYSLSLVGPPGASRYQIVLSFEGEAG